MDLPPALECVGNVRANGLNHVVPHEGDLARRGSVFVHAHGDFSDQPIGQFCYVGIEVSVQARSVYEGKWSS